MMTYLCAHCGDLAEVPFLEAEVFDSGTTLTCNRCGQDTILNLSTQKEYVIRRRIVKAKGRRCSMSTGMRRQSIWLWGKMSHQRVGEAA